MKKVITFILLSCILLNAYTQVVDANMDSWYNYIEMTSIESVNYKGVLPYIYCFSDSSCRNISLQFTERETLSISNCNRNSNLLNFIDIYKVHFENNNNLLVVDSIINTNRKEFIPSHVISPFEYEEEFNCCNTVFPILANGTIIRISRSYQDISINNFCFHIKTYTDSDKKEFEYLLWKQLNE